MCFNEEEIPGNEVPGDDVVVEDEKSQPESVVDLEAVINQQIAAAAVEAAPKSIQEAMKSSNPGLPQAALDASILQSAEVITRDSERFKAAKAWRP